jgi:hypothetical protein
VLVWAGSEVPAGSELAGGIAGIRPPEEEATSP